jgi:hypothetical protein
VRLYKISGDYLSNLPTQFKKGAGAVSQLEPPLKISFPLLKKFDKKYISISCNTCHALTAVVIGLQTQVFHILCQMMIEFNAGLFSRSSNAHLEIACYRHFDFMTTHATSISEMLVCMYAV